LDVTTLRFRIKSGSCASGAEILIRVAVFVKPNYVRIYSNVPQRRYGKFEVGCTSSADLLALVKEQHG
ncbi:MAG: hypothetical protein ACP5O6_10885, partial [Candidatus Baltobacteraceae bacterium]